MLILAGTAALAMLVGIAMLVSMDLMFAASHEMELEALTPPPQQKLSVKFLCAKVMWAITKGVANLANFGPLTLAATAAGLLALLVCP